MLSGLAGAATTVCLPELLFYIFCKKIAPLKEGAPLNKPRLVCYLVESKSAAANKIHLCQENQ